MLRARESSSPRKDPREDERDVHGVREVGAPGGDDLRAGRARGGGRDLRLRHGKGEDDRVRRHGADHLLADDAAGGETDEDVGALQHLGQAAAAARGSSPWRDRPSPSSCARAGTCRAHRRGRRRRVAHPGPGEQAGDADPGDAGAGDDDLDVLELLADDLQRVDETAQDEDRRAVVLVGEDRDVRAVLQVVGDGEGARRRDVVEADGAEGRGERETGLHDPVRVRGSQGEREGVDPGEGLEDDALGFFEGDGGFRWARFPAEDIGAVGEDGDGVAATGEIERRQRILVDGQTGFRDTGGVDEGEDGPVPDGDLRADADQPLIPPPVIEPFLLELGQGSLAATGSIAGGMPVTRPFPDSISWPVVVSPVLVTRSFYVVWSREKPSSSEPGLCYQIVPTIRHSDCIGVWQPVPDYRLGAL